MQVTHGTHTVAQETHDQMMQKLITSIYTIYGWREITFEYLGIFN